jgi:hypothetical protein
MSALRKRSFRPRLEALEDRLQPSATALAVLAPPNLPAAAVARHLPAVQESIHGNQGPVLQQTAATAAGQSLADTQSSRSGDIIRRLEMWANSARAHVQYEPYHIANVWINPNAGWINIRGSVSWLEWTGFHSADIFVRPDLREPGKYEIYAAPVFRSGGLFIVELGIVVDHQGGTTDWVRDAKFFAVSATKTSGQQGDAWPGANQDAAVLAHSLARLTEGTAARDQFFAVPGQQPVHSNVPAAQHASSQMGQAGRIDWHLGEVSIPGSQHSSPSTGHLDAAFQQLALDATWAQ